MNFTVYNSSAGSGKTFTLVTEYLSLALTDAAKFRNILAITFTNKAAQEMKQRILLSLKEIAGYRVFPNSVSVKYMLPEIIKKTGFEKEEISKKSEKLLSLILHNYSEFAISTIDSFVHKVIRNFSFDLKIAMNFELELDTEGLLKKIIDILISKTGSDEKLTQFLVNYTKSKTDEDKSWNIEGDLLNVSKILLLEDGQLHIENLKNISLHDFTRIIHRTMAYVRSFENKVVEIATRANTLVQSKNISNDSFYRGRYGIGSYFKNLANRQIGKIEPNSYVTATVSEDKWLAGKALSSDKIAITEIKSDLIRFFDSIQEMAKSNLIKYFTYIEILKNLYPVAILNEIEKIIVEYKNENDILMISEFNKRIASIVLNEPVPFIYERIGEKYKHYLVDEFQDTSILQWQNFLPLIDNSLSEGHFNLVVGDGKQAIYRWRNGEVEQFISLPHIFKPSGNQVQIQQEQALVRNYSPKVLDHNFRSKYHIIEFNNSFFHFARHKLNPSFQKIYQDSEQKTSTTTNDGYVQIDFFDKGTSELSLSEFNLILTKSTIKELISEGYQPRDIAVLCRSNKHASLIASDLLTDNIQVVSSESLLLSSSPEVRLLIAIMRIMINNNDQVSKAEVCNWLGIAGSRSKNLNEHLTESGSANFNFRQNEETNQDFFLYLKTIGYKMNL
ncbi:MAG: UvrD-helicase domain-containing protein, partial [Bacteroidales bacterium]|nr:UvrD-helicase domain-containing protein [Bacteroidales bacterium]